MLGLGCAEHPRPWNPFRAQPQALMPLMETTLQVLELPRPRKTPPDIYALFDDVCAFHGLEREWVASRCRSKHIVVARNEFLYRALAETSVPIAEVAAFLCMHLSSLAYAAAAHALDHDLPIPRGACPSRVHRADSRRKRPDNSELSTITAVEGLTVPA
jgi:hypothetical protein